MKRLLLSLSALSLVGGHVLAQHNQAGDAHSIPADREMAMEKSVQLLPVRKSSSANVIWSEDFANGIPSSWTSAGFDIDASGNFIPNPLCEWEYRGPNTNPDATMGSRGAFAGGQPISSPTRANGFIIFDSDYLDNGGDPNNIGGGDSPAPHIGILTTDTIDCSGINYVEISMQSYIRHFSSLYQVAISTDGGTTYNDTLRFHPNVAVNSASANPVRVGANISSIVANEPDVVLQIIYDGSYDDPGANDVGYYFWMIDDIEVAELPANAFQFTSWQGAPPKDVIYPAGHPKYGRPQVDQAAQLPVSFDANILNYGWRDQTNVTLKVEILDASNNVVTTLTSPTLSNLASGDTGDFNDFTTTTSWTPSTVGDFNAVFTVESDSIPANGTSPSDTIPFRIQQDRHAAHFGQLDNVVGVANGAVSLAQAFTIPADVDTNGYVLLGGISTYISSASDTTGSIIVEIYDTTGFSYGASGGPAGSPVGVKTLSLNQGNVGQVTTVDFTTNGVPLALPSNRGYLVVLNLVPNATNGDIRIGNDQTVATPPGLIGMLADDGNWYSGFQNSRTLSNLIIDMHFETIGLEEALALRESAIQLYPNPTSGELNLEFNQGGTYQMEVMTYTGQQVYREEITVNGNEQIQRDFSHLSPGAYIVNLRQGDQTTTRKLILE